MGSITSVGVAINAMDFGSDLDRLDHALAFVETTGADHAEIGLHHFTTVVACKTVEKRVRELETICRRHPIGYTVHAPDVLNLMDQEYPALHRELASVMVEQAARIGATALVIHSGRAPESCGRVQFRRLMDLECRALDDLATLAARDGVAIAVENLGPNPFVAELDWDDVSELAHALASIGNPNLGLALDVTHAAISCAALGDDFTQAMEASGPAVNHIHLNDCAPRPGYGFFGGRYIDKMILGIDDVHYPLGWGTVDLDETFRHLHLQRDVRLSLEIEERFSAEVPDSVQRARNLARVVGQSSRTGSLDAVTSGQGSGE